MGDPDIEFLIAVANYKRVKKKLEFVISALYEIAYPAYFGGFLSAQNIAREIIEKIEEEE